MLQYLSDRMYDEVRGPGLTYGVSMSLSITEGRSSLSLTRYYQGILVIDLQPTFIDLPAWLKLTKQSRRSLKDMSAMKMLGMKTWQPQPRDL